MNTNQTLRFITFSASRQTRMAASCLSTPTQSVSTFSSAHLRDFANASTRTFAITITSSPTNGQATATSAHAQAATATVLCNTSNSTLGRLSG